MKLSMIFAVTFSSMSIFFSFTFSTFLPRDYFLLHNTPFVQAIHPQTDAGDKKKAIYKLGYLHSHNTAGRANRKG
jgi:hypothetical protein